MQGSLTITFSVGSKIPVSGSFTVGLPYQNSQYAGLGIAPTRSMIVSQSSLTVSASYLVSAFEQFVQTGSTTTSLGSVSWTFKTESSDILIKMQLENTSVIAAGSVLTVVLSKILMPPCLSPLSGVQIYTGDTSYYMIEFASYMTITNTLPATEASTSYTSTASIETLTGVLEEDQTYQFSVQTIGDIPMNGYFTLQIPTAVGLPTDPATGITLSCVQFCSESTITLTYTSASRTLTFSGAVPNEQSYIVAPGPLTFTLSGFTNPSSTDPAYFVFKSYAALSDGNYLIDEISSMYIQAQQGTCTITKFYATDGNYMIYGVAQNWTATLSCQHNIYTTGGIRLTFPSDWYIIETSACVMGGQNAVYKCSAIKSTRTITITNFLKKDLIKGTQFTFNINSIRNPAVVGQSYVIQFESLSESGGVADLGTFTTSSSLFVYGNIKTFTVTPQNYGVGQFPVYYAFVIQPSGEVYKGSYFVLELPDTVSIYSAREVEKQCDYSVSGFTNNRINCQVSGNLVTINTGFQFSATTAMTIDDKMIPPTFKFTLPQFLNPRTMEATGPFGLTIYDSNDKAIYTWNTTKSLTLNGQTVSSGITAGPAVQMSTAATPQSIVISQGSTQNGAITDYNLTITTTNYLVEGDEIIVQLPNSMYFSQDSKCLGKSSNLRMNQTYTVSSDLTKMTVSLLLPLNLRRLQAGSLNKIQAGSAFILTLTSVKNSQSTAPTSSIIVSAYTGGNLIEQQSSGLIIQNTVAGVLSDTYTTIIPDDFRQSYTTNYTLTFKPVNYDQNMFIVLQLPKQVMLGSNAVNCFGVVGTDSQNLTCATNVNKKQINITNAVQFQKSNPGTISIIFQTFKNPSTNLVTDSFNLTTYTSSGYILDQLKANLVINFFCQYPCMTCDKVQKDMCNSCYPQNDFSIFFSYQCLETCPPGFCTTNYSPFNCTECKKPCATCYQETKCTSCIDGYWLNSEVCLETVYWPFPWIALAMFQFFLICVSEVWTKKESRFKEAFIAMLCVPEIGSWTSFMTFHFLRKGYLGAFAFASIASFIYILLNIVHAFVHPLKIVPQSEQSYKSLSSNFRCSTTIIRVMSYLFSFKMSLILVSYFCMRPQFQGDYSQNNWRHFNRFSLAFLVLCYPTMMFACGYYLYFDGLFSYCGFASLEVIVISSLMSMIMLLDSLSALRCRVGPNKKKVEPGNFQINTGQEYESEDDKTSKRILKKHKQQDEFGEANSETSFRPQQSDHSQAGRKLAVLEEIAIQMRNEKELLRLEKERIERERLAYNATNDDFDQQSMSQQKLYDSRHRENFNDSVRIAKRNQVLQDPRSDYYSNQDQQRSYYHQQETYPQRQLVRNTDDLFQEPKRPYLNVEQEMEEADQQDVDQRLYRKQFGEQRMVDYHDIAEHAEFESGVLTRSRYPQAIYGQEQYLREVENSEQQVLQLTPRAGGASIMGQYDLHDEGEVQIVSQDAPFFGQVKDYESMNESHLMMIRSQASFAITNVRSDLNDSVFYQLRPDALMEQDSNQSIELDEQLLNQESAQVSYDNQADEHNECQQPCIVPLFEVLDDNIPDASCEQQYLEQRTAVKGDTAPPLSQYEGKDVDFIQNDDQSAFGINKNVLEREGTPVEYFNGSFYSKGIPSDFQRSLIATQEGHFELPNEFDKNDQEFSQHYAPLRAETSKQTDEDQDFVELNSQETERQRIESKLSNKQKSVTNRQSPFSHKTALKQESTFSKYKSVQKSMEGSQKAEFDDENNESSADQMEKSQVSQDELGEVSKQRSGFSQYSAGTNKDDGKHDKTNKQSTARMKKSSLSKLSKLIESSHQALDQELEHTSQKQELVEQTSQQQLNKLTSQHESGNQNSQGILKQPSRFHQYSQLSMHQLERLQKSQLNTYNRSLASQKHFKAQSQNALDQDYPCRYSNTITEVQGEQIIGYPTCNPQVEQLTDYERELITSAQQQLPAQVAAFDSVTVKTDLRLSEEYVHQEAKFSQNSVEENEQNLEFFGPTSPQYSRQMRRLSSSHEFMEREVAQFSRDSDQQVKQTAELFKNEKSLGQFGQVKTKPIEASESFLQHQADPVFEAIKQQSDFKSKQIFQHQRADSRFEEIRIEKQEFQQFEAPPSEQKPQAVIQRQNQIQVKQEQIVDSSGHSESSEGIIDHNPFTSQVAYHLKRGKQDAQSKSVEVASFKQRPLQPKREVIYSDKSESSVEELMGDTPSNYNFANGRLDGKSNGLKASQVLTQKLAANILQNKLGAPFGVTKSNQMEEKKFVNLLENLQSKGGWQDINMPISPKLNRINIIEEEGAQMQQKGKQKQKAIKTNKTFAEVESQKSRDHRYRQNQTTSPPPISILSQVQKNNYI